MTNQTNIHPAAEALLEHFGFEHLPPNLRHVSASFHALAHEMAYERGLDGPEMTTGLRKLLEAKDCMVRAARTQSAEFIYDPDTLEALRCVAHRCSPMPEGRGGRKAQAAGLIEQLAVEDRETYRLTARGMRVMLACRIVGESPRSGREAGAEVVAPPGVPLPERVSPPAGEPLPPIS